MTQKPRTRWQKIWSVKKRVARERLSVAKAMGRDGGTEHENAGTITTKSGGGRRGRVRYGRVGVVANRGGVIGDPAVVLAQKIRWALTAPQRISAVTVYDAQGRAIAMMDPHTRKRTVQE